MQLLEFSWYTTHVNTPKPLTTLNIHRLKKPSGHPAVWDFSSCQQSQGACSLDARSEEPVFLGVYASAGAEPLAAGAGCATHLPGSPPLLS